ncbi:hypothetical protein ACE103_34605 [Bradyrhizobium sp. ma5]|uniref:hypothetical protein n=1 Tax=Bradyrhizobium sp. ma5 TaxID=3344828 RepID=UPI0035D3F344
MSSSYLNAMIKPARHPLTVAVAIWLVPYVLAANANAQSCLTGPIKTKDGSLQTWTVDNRCGSPVTMRYFVKGSLDSVARIAVVPACSKQRIVQTFETDQIEFLDTAYNPGWEKVCPPLDKENRSQKRPDKSTNDADQIHFPTISPAPLAGPKPLGPAGDKPGPRG